MDEVAKIMCTPTSWETELVQGSTQQTGDCGHTVWVAPSSMAMKAEAAAKGERVVFHCIPCALTSAEVIESMRANGVNLHPAQREELNETLGVGLTDQIAAALERVRQSPQEGTP